MCVFLNARFIDVLNNTRWLHLWKVLRIFSVKLVLRTWEVQLQWSEMGKEFALEKMAYGGPSAVQEWELFHAWSMTYKAQIWLIFIPSFSPTGIIQAQIKPIQIPSVNHLRLVCQSLSNTTFVLTSNS